MHGLKSCLTILSDADCAKIHEAATHILATVGMRVEHERLLDMAEEEGYDVRRDTMRVLWTREQIEQAIHERVNATPDKDSVSTSRSKLSILADVECSEGG